MSPMKFTQRLRPRVQNCRRCASTIKMASGQAKASTMTADPKTYNRIRFELVPLVARILLANPPLNVIDIPMMEEHYVVLTDVEAHPEICAVVISGEGKCFSVGVDVAAHSPDQVAAVLGKFHAFIRAIVASRKATIAVVPGPCLGGAELAMVCDLVYTTADAQ